MSVDVKLREVRPITIKGAIIKTFTYSKDNKMTTILRGDVDRYQ